MLTIDEGMEVAGMKSQLSFHREALKRYKTEFYKAIASMDKEIDDIDSLTKKISYILMQSNKL